MQAQSLSAQFSQIFKRSSSFNYQFLVLSRFFIAIVGGYFFTAASTSLLSFLLPLTKSDAVLLCVSLSILIYALVFIYAFYVKSLKIVWISILLSTGAQISLLVALKDWL
ncbi:hypothetical protein [Pseudoalteromonas sp. S558]|uniref:hypothetical protein n=1 Tax=Pseudoalteromonas sp. S558 TaxID=2066515 RepID=UPI00110A37BF|nr:hypothetical protein [Pseudoalteromonas sp. S558]TMO09949.1 hypothetical protein CWB66_01200 [Pseudoalteromonas sp. S558]